MGWREDVVHIDERLELPFQKGSDEHVHFMALSLAGEVGELANQIKKFWRGDYDPATTDAATYVEARENIAEEIGDIAVVLQMLSSALGLDFEKEARRVVSGKLAKRWPHVRPLPSESE